jgi:hypothetical protein
MDTSIDKRFTVVSVSVGVDSLLSLQGSIVAQMTSLILNKFLRRWERVGHMPTSV